MSKVSQAAEQISACQGLLLGGIRRHLKLSFLIFMCISPPVIEFYNNKNNLNSKVKSQSCRPDVRCQMPSPLCNCSTDVTQTGKLIN